MLPPHEAAAAEAEAARQAVEEGPRAAEPQSCARRRWPAPRPVWRVLWRRGGRRRAAPTDDFVETVEEEAIQSVVQHLTPFGLNRNLPWQIYATRRKRFARVPAASAPAGAPAARASPKPEHGPEPELSLRFPEARQTDLALPAIPSAADGQPTATMAPGSEASLGGGLATVASVPLARMPAQPSGDGIASASAQLEALYSYNPYAIFDGVGYDEYDSETAALLAPRPALRSVYDQPVRPPTTRKLRPRHGGVGMVFPPVRGAEPYGHARRAWPSPRSRGRPSSPRVLHAQGAYIG